MIIPPFPSQDLAKLVLGYLAEEQLMTAYDEFLQASPYLDVLRNEYDRIFMTSLRNILAEYRAVKIYVETCKPLLLRKKLFQCPNLLDVVRFLINNIDVNKIQDPAFDKISSFKQYVCNTQKNICGPCSICKSPNCICQKQTNTQPVVSHNVEASSLENSVEATSLDDLPGNHVTSRKKQIRTIEKDSTVLQYTMDVTQNNELRAKQILNTKCDTYVQHTQVTMDQGSATNHSTLKQLEHSDPKYKIEESNNIINKVCCNSNTERSLNSNNSGLTPTPKRMSITTTFQDFSSGVVGLEKCNTALPDSSTTENINRQAPVPKNPNEIFIKGNLNKSANTSHLLMVTSLKNTERIQTNSPVANVTPVVGCRHAKLKPNHNPNLDDHKIRILSDVKVGNTMTSNDTLNNIHGKTVMGMRNATSTPYMQMRTIVINGTPAFRQNPQNENYTKDEIMAMPTIIVVPASGSTDQFMVKTQPKFSNPINSNQTMTTSTPTLQPLVIDVTSSPESNTLSKCNNKDISCGVQGTNDSGLIKTVDVTKNASVPKDNVIATSVASNTPQALPPTRKSSSTPRRTKHVRVLDFATPRRILHETINECIIAPNDSVDNASDKVSNLPELDSEKVVKSDKSNIVAPLNAPRSENKPNDLKENKTTDKPNNKKNWDADLRALLVSNEKQEGSSSSKSKNKKKKRAVDNIETMDTKSTVNKNVKQKTGNSRKKKKAESAPPITVDLEVNKVSIPIKPTINIVMLKDRVSPDISEKKEDTNNQGANNKKEQEDTPETERLSLQDVMGSKLNISELLETPYKQALYDIQMDTPRFLGSDLPDEPMSDIKIMSIPTPQFLNTSKPVQATPSSYSSRPTDYSSGGSYYKPDDQDYLRIPELESPVTSTNDRNPDEIKNVTKENGSDVRKNPRPVRKCTKNVSYVKIAGIGQNKDKSKTKVQDDNSDAASSCSDISVNVSLESNFEEKQKNCKTSKSKSKRQDKVQTKQKKYKSPHKKETSKSFMKIKPRRVTPVKNTRSKRKTPDSSKLQIKKRTTSKEKNVTFTPVLVSAPTKSRRKSSTPRKLHCSKSFNSESSDRHSPVANADNKVATKDNVSPVSDNELLLRWSDEGSQEIKQNKLLPSKPVVQEDDDIRQIQEYIETTNNIPTKTEGSIQLDLVKRGFDVETAKIIERDLLKTPPHSEPQKLNVPPKVPDAAEYQSEIHEVDKSVDSDYTPNKLVIVQEDSDEEEIELSVYECNEHSANFVTCCHDETRLPHQRPLHLLKDKFSMEVCIDDGVTIRLRSTQFNLLLDQDPECKEDGGISCKETEIAVNSITSNDTLSTPIKECIRAQCYDIFDSTLTSLDTPLKPVSTKEKDSVVTITEILLEEEKVEEKPKKRKRIHSGNESDEYKNEFKRKKPEAEYLLNSANIQNIDIESVLKKLHGP